MRLELCAKRSGKLRGFLRNELNLSAGLVSRLKDTGDITVNGTFVFTDFAVEVGDVISVEIVEEYPDFPPESMDLTILYEDSSIIALDKPPGMLMHPTANRHIGTLANGLLGYYIKTGQKCGIHPISRLDRDTFGVVLFAKNGHIHHRFQGNIQKIYHGLVWGAPLVDGGVIDLGIGRKAGSLFRFLDKNGKNAVTKYRVLQRGQWTSLLELVPVTGRTHQLRLHCKALGHPLVGEPFYSWFPRKKGEYQQLLAQKILFTHPITGEQMEIASRLSLWQRRPEGAERVFRENEGTVRF
ncbi:MAG: RluA family pseudouridine synthase [Eubacteriales bacterium]